MNGNIARAVLGIALSLGSAYIFTSRRWRLALIRAARDDTQSPVWRAAMLSFGGLGPVMLFVMGAYVFILAVT